MENFLVGDMESTLQFISIFVQCCHLLSVYDAWQFHYTSGGGSRARKIGGEERVAEIRNEYGGCNIEKAFNFKREEEYTEAVKIQIQTEAVLSPEQAKEMTTVLEKAVEEAKRIVEKW
jgi:hypothetical protein